MNNLINPMLRRELACLIVNALPNDSVYELAVDCVIKSLMALDTQEFLSMAKDYGMEVSDE